MLTNVDYLIPPFKASFVKLVRVMTCVLRSLVAWRPEEISSGRTRQSSVAQHSSLSTCAIGME